MTKTYKSKVFGEIHEIMQDAYDAGVVDKKTMRQFDESCLTEAKPLTPEAITTCH